MMDIKKKAEVFLREYNLCNPKIDLMLLHLARATRLPIPEILIKINQLADKEVEENTPTKETT